MQDCLNVDQPGAGNHRCVVREFEQPSGDGPCRVIREIRECLGYRLRDRFIEETFSRVYFSRIVTDAKCCNRLHRGRRTEHLFKRIEVCWHKVRMLHKVDFGVRGGTLRHHRIMKPAELYRLHLRWFVQMAPG